MTGGDGNVYPVDVGDDADEEQEKEYPPADAEWVGGMGGVRVMQEGEMGNRLYARFDLLECVSCSMRVLAKRYSSSSVAIMPSNFALKIVSKTRVYAGPLGRPMSSRSWPVKAIEVYCQVVRYWRTRSMAL